MTRHRSPESCLALVHTLLLASLVVSSSAALTREATTRTASPLTPKDPTTTTLGRQQQHSVATRTPPVLAAAQPRVDINASIREIHNNTTTTNATDAHGNVEQSRWWWWWTWWAAPRVVYIYPGHQQQYPHNPNPYPPVQPPLVEPNCPQVTTGNGQPVRDCCCPSGCAISGTQGPACAPGGNNGQNTVRCQPGIACNPWCDTFAGGCQAVPTQFNYGK